MPAGITWLGHSTVLVEVDGVRILTDPVLRSHVGPLVRVAPPVRTETLHDIDVVVLSHLHADHVDLKSLRILGDDVTVIAPLGTGAWLRRRGVSKVREIEVGEAASIGSVSVTATHALHDGRRHRLAPHSE